MPAGKRTEIYQLRPENVTYTATHSHYSEHQLKEMLADAEVLGKVVYIQVAIGGGYVKGHFSASSKHMFVYPSHLKLTVEEWILQGGVWET